MQVSIEVVGNRTRVKMVPTNNTEKTFLHVLVNQLPNATNHSGKKIYVSETDYGLAGLAGVVLVSKEPVAKW